MKDEHKADVGRLVKVLLESERVSVHDLRNMLVGYSEATIGTLIWSAREVVRKETGIDFGPLAGHPGTLQRRTPDQVAKYSGRQRAAGYRKCDRALQRLRSAAETVADPKEKERLARKAERERERLNFRKRREI